MTVPSGTKSDYLLWWVRLEAVPGSVFRRRGAPEPVVRPSATCGEPASGDCGVGRLRRGIGEDFVSDPPRHQQGHVCCHRGARRRPRRGSTTDLSGTSGPERPPSACPQVISLPPRRVADCNLSAHTSFNGGIQ